MAVYNVYLVDYTYSGIGHHPDIQLGTPVVMDATRKQSMKSRLESYFALICHGTNYSPVVSWVESPPQSTTIELVCYCLETIADSIATWKRWYAISGVHDGFTQYHSERGTLSELYLDRNFRNINLLADLCMHELMHNKLESPRRRGFDLHRADAHGMGQESLNEGHYSFTQWDTTTMRDALSRNQPQVVIRKDDYLAYLNSPVR